LEKNLQTGESQKGKSDELDEGTKPNEEEVIKPFKEVSKPVEEVAKPLEKVAEPLEKVAKSAEEVAKSAEEVAKPLEKIANLLEKIAKPAEKVAKPAEEFSKPAEEDSKPAEKDSKPAEEGSKPIDEIAKPSEEVSKSIKEFSKTTEGVVREEITERINEDKTIPTEEETKPTNKEGALSTDEDGTLPTEEDGTLPTEEEGTPPIGEEGTPPTEEETEPTNKVITLPTEEETNPTKEDNTLPIEEKSKPTKEKSKLTEESMQSEEDVTLPTEKITPINKENLLPLNDVTTSFVESMSQSHIEESKQTDEQMTLPDEETTPTVEDTIQPDEDTIQPDEDTIQPDENTIQPDENTIHPNENTIQPDEEVKPTDEDMLLPDDDSKAANEEITTSGEEMRTEDEEMFSPGEETVPFGEIMTPIVDKATQPMDEEDPLSKDEYSKKTKDTDAKLTDEETKKKNKTTPQIDEDTRPRIQNTEPTEDENIPTQFVENDKNEECVDVGKTNDEIQLQDVDNATIFAEIDIDNSKSGAVATRAKLCSNLISQDDPNEDNCELSSGEESNSDESEIEYEYHEEVPKSKTLAEHFEFISNSINPTRTQDERYHEIIELRFMDTKSTREKILTEIGSVVNKIFMKQTPKYVNLWSDIYKGSYIECNIDLYSMLNRYNIKCNDALMGLALLPAPAVSQRTKRVYVVISNALKDSQINLLIKAYTTIFDMGDDEKDELPKKLKDLWHIQMYFVSEKEVDEDNLREHLMAAISFYPSNDGILVIYGCVTNVDFSSDIKFVNGRLKVRKLGVYRLMLHLIQRLNIDRVKSERMPTRTATRLKTTKFNAAGYIFLQCRNDETACLVYSKMGFQMVGFTPPSYLPKQLVNFLNGVGRDCWNDDEKPKKPSNKFLLFQLKKELPSRNEDFVRPKDYEADGLKEMTSSPCGAGIHCLDKNCLLWNMYFCAGCGFWCHRLCCYKAPDDCHNITKNTLSSDGKIIPPEGVVICLKCKHNNRCVTSGTECRGNTHPTISTCFRANQCILNWHKCIHCGSLCHSKCSVITNVPEGLSDEMYPRYFRGRAVMCNVCAQLQNETSLSEVVQDLTLLEQADEKAKKRAYAEEGRDKRVLRKGEINYLEYRPKRKKQKWFGKVDKDDPYEELEWRWLNDNFDSKFLEHVRSHPDKLIFDPVGSALTIIDLTDETKKPKVLVEMIPSDEEKVQKKSSKVPVIYPSIWCKQHGKNVCLFACAASMFKHIEQNDIAERLKRNMGKSENHVENLENLLLIVTEGYKEKGERVLINVFGDGQFDPLSRKERNRPTILLLKDREGGIKHSVAIVNHYYFDATRERTSAITREALDYSCRGHCLSIGKAIQVKRLGKRKCKTKPLMKHGKGNR